MSSVENDAVKLRTIICGLYITHYCHIRHLGYMWNMLNYLSITKPKAYKLQSCLKKSLDLQFQKFIASYWCCKPRSIPVDNTTTERKCKSRMVKGMRLYKTSKFINSYKLFRPIYVSYLWSHTDLPPLWAFTEVRRKKQISQTQCIKKKILLLTRDGSGTA